MRELLMAMMTFASQVTGLPVPFTPPHVVFQEQADLMRRAERGTPRAVLEAGIGGYTRPSSGNIMMPNTWNEADPHDRARLAHEVTHYLQIRARVHLAGGCEAELQAERVQRAWLQEKEKVDPVGMRTLSQFYCPK